MMEHQEDAPRPEFRTWAKVELMGHRVLVGLVSEQQVFGKMLLRVDVPDEKGGMFTQLYGPDSLYCLTPIEEKAARALADRYRPEPVSRWEVPSLPHPSRDGSGEDDLPFDDAGGA